MTIYDASELRVKIMQDDEFKELGIMSGQKTTVENAYAKHFTNRMKEKVMSAISVVDGKPHVEWDDVTFDFYDIANSFEMANEQVRHATKKQLQSGGRVGGKSQLQDLNEAIWSLQEGINELTKD